MHTLLVLTAALAAGADVSKGPVLSGRPLASWVADLADPDVLVREEALEVLGGAGQAAKAAAPEIEKLLRAEPASLRLRAGLALWHIRGDKNLAAEALGNYLRTAPGTNARIRTLMQLRELGAEGAAAVGAVLDLTEDEDMSLRTQARVTISAMGRSALPALAAALGDPAARRRRQAAAVLSSMGPLAGEAATALEGRLADDDLAVRVHSGRALWMAGHSTRRVLDALAAGVRAGDYELRAEALDTVLMFVDSRRRPMVRPVLEAALHAPDPATRMRAAAGLYSIDGKADVVLPVLREGLKSPDRRVWSPAARGLANLGPKAAPAVPALVDLLRRPEGSYAFEVHDALARVGAPAVGPVLEILSDPGASPQQTQGATNALTRMGPVAVPKVGPLLEHHNVLVRAAACRVLGQGGEAARPLVAKLTERLKDDQVQVRQAALEALGNLGPVSRESTDAVVKLAEDPQVWIRVQALQALTQMGTNADKARPAALAALKDANLVVRANGLGLLAATDPRHPDLLPRARDLLKEGMTRSQALAVISRMGAAAAPLAPALVEAMREENNVIQRRQLANILTRVGPAAREAAPELVKLLQDKDLFTRQSAAVALRAVGIRRDEVPAVVAAIRRDPQSYSRGLLIELLGEQGPAAAGAADLLVEELRRPNWTNQVHAAGALARVAPERARKEGVPAVEKWLQNASYHMAAADAMLRMDPRHKEALATVRKALADDEPTRWYPRQQAAEIIGTLGPAAKDAVPDLRAALKDPQPPVRWSAAFALWQVNGDADAAVTVLVDGLRPGPAPFQRYQAVRKLGDMGPAARGALPELRVLSGDPDIQVRNLAAEAVRKIDPKARKAGVP
jgi:HEAT repeat protein